MRDARDGGRPTTAGEAGRANDQEPRMVSDQISPLVLHQLAVDFLAAAQREWEAVNPPNEISSPLPAYFLVGRSLELQLKAFLRLQGASERDLRTVSHDLERAICTARESGLEKYVKLSESEVESVGRLNAYYGAKELEYPHAGLQQHADFDVLARIAVKLRRGIEVPLQGWRPGP